MALILCTHMGDWRSLLVMEQSFTIRDLFHSEFDLESLYNRQVELSSIIDLSRNRVLSCNGLLNLLISLTFNFPK